MRTLLTFLCTFLSLAAVGQTLNVIGDSYVANHKRPREEAWHCLLANELGLKYNNYGRNGGCIAFDRTHDGPYNFGPALWQRYTAMDPEADYVIIIAGHNDAGKVGHSADSLRMFADSLEVLLSGIERHCPKARIGFVTPWWVDRPGFAEVVGVIREACQRHGIPVLDNYRKRCPVKVRSAEFRASYFQAPEDTAHLNAEGHRLYLEYAMKWFKKHMLR